MNTTPDSAILEFEAVLEMLYVDPASGKKEAKIVYRPPAESCLVHVHFDDEQAEAKQLKVDIFLFEKIRQLGYLREVKGGEDISHREYCLTDDVLTLGQIRAICEEWVRRKKDRQEMLARLARQRSQRGEQQPGEGSQPEQ